ncbi:MAG TPA: hypothetical protein VHC86_16585 [Opitutaceae bacterium]|nr:hypothetical protein [Opitutaceae bacterium]
MRRLRVLALACLGAALAGRAAAEAPDPLVPIPPLPALAGYAASARVPLSGIDPAAGESAAVLLVTSRQPSRERQWLVRLRFDPLSAEEAARPAPPEDVFYTTTGRVLRFPYARAALAIDWIGPFTSDPRSAAEASVRRARAIVNANYLRQGIADYCRDGLDLARRIEAAGGAADLVFGGGGRPPSPAVLAQGRKSAARIGLRPDEERLAFSVYFALNTIFRSASQVPACREVLEEVVDKPSVFSLVRNFGVRVDFNYGWMGVREVPPAHARVPLPTYTLPVRLNLNLKPGVDALLAVTTPTRALAECAGIVALSLQKPSEPDRRVFFQLVATQR